MIYYVCCTCNMYHTAGKSVPRRCKRCNGNHFERVTVDDPSFNWVMKAAQDIYSRNKKEIQ